jgi:SAM-dependent methyltransferase
VTTLDAEFGAIDIYLFDQLLRGRITRADRIVDAGCGSGRNLVYFLRNGFDVWALDADADRIADVRALAAEIGGDVPADRFRVEPLEHGTLPDRSATVVISSAVLHFARDDDEFQRMLEGTWRLVAPGGMFFCRLASSIGIETRITPVDSNAHTHRYRLPDGTTRYLVDQSRLLQWTEALGGRLLDPIKTTVVQDQRAMTTWVVRRM